MTQTTAPAPAAPQTPPPDHAARRVLFVHHLHPHLPRNVNLVHAAEQQAGGFNTHVAVGMTNVFQAMPTFWLILAWIVLWIAVNATILRFDPLPWPLLLALASVPQLPLMIVIMVGQGLLGRKQELMSEEQFNTTQKIYHDMEQSMQHLSAQDDELLRQTRMLLRLLEAAGIAGDQGSAGTLEAKADKGKATTASAPSGA